MFALRVVSPSHLSSDSPAFSTTKKGSAGAASRVKAELYDKLSDFGKETEEASADRTRRYVARMNYAIRDKEISLQQDEIHFGHENAKAEFLHLMPVTCASGSSLS